MKKIGFGLKMQAGEFDANFFKIPSKTKFKQLMRKK